jgi:hypothetical protein
MDRIRLSKKKPPPPPPPVWRKYRAHIAAGVAVLLVAVLYFAFFTRPPTGTTDPIGKLRLEKLLRMYQFHATKKGKGPANEQALKDFIKNLSAEEKKQYEVPDDVDALFVSPRDGQPYTMRYGVVPNPSSSEPLIWEQAGQDGKRFVALSMGYVEEKSDDEFQALRKK